MGPDVHSGRNFFGLGPRNSCDWFCLARELSSWAFCAGLKKRFFKAQPSGFWGFYWFFLHKQEKIGKIIQKLSNLKP